MAIKTTGRTSGIRGRKAGLILSSCLATLALARPVIALAQQADDVQEVTITGSRIKAPNLTSESPVTAISDAELKQQGTTNVEALLNDLPSVYASQGNTTSNGSNGTATLNLRGLGVTRTLVLIDGRRIGPGDPNSASGAAADVNFIPAGLISGIEVLTGGASAAYGSDAIAGVVNFHLLRNFDGVMVDEQFSAADHQQGSSLQGALAAAPYASGAVAVPKGAFDGFTRDSTGVIGVNSADNKGNLTAYVEYRSTSPVLAGTRDWDACQTGLNSAKTALVCTGSSTNAYGIFTPNGSKKTYSNNPNGTATFVPYTSALAYNANPLGVLQRDDDRTSLGAIGHYQVKPWMDVYAEVMFMKDQTTEQTAPGGIFTSGVASGALLSIPCDNQFLSASQASTLCGASKGTVSLNSWPGLRFTSDPRQIMFTHEDYRAVAGARGDIDSAWSYDVSGSYWDTDVEQQDINYVSFSKLEQSLGDGCTGSCVPVNIFQYGGVTPSAMNYLFAPGSVSSSAREMTVDANFNGDLGAYGIKSPFAGNSLAVAFGLEYRRDELNVSPDYELQTGDLLGTGGSPPQVSGGEAVKEEFAELFVPVAENLPFIKAVNLDLALRHSDYTVDNSNSAFSTNTYKITADYAPNDDVRLRGGFNRAARAPNIFELFQPSSYTISTVSGGDPCSGASPQASLAACAKSGVTAAQYGNVANCVTNQCESRAGGNTALKPEEADTWSWGMNLTPDFIPGFNASIDYWDVRVSNYITQEAGSAILDGCLLQGVTSLCSLIHRNPLTGDVDSAGAGYLVTNNTNFGFLHNRGIDFEMNYRTELAQLGFGDLGALTFKMNGTYGLQSTISGQTTYDCQGLFGAVCNGNGASDPRFDWRHQARLTWATPWDLDLSVNWRYMSSVSLDTNSSQAALNNGSYDAADAKIPAYSYIDLSASYRLWKNYTLRAGVTNLFDKDPPVLSQTVVPAGTVAANGNSYSGAYDVLGRVIFAGFNAKF